MKTGMLRAVASIAFFTSCSSTVLAMEPATPSKKLIYFTTQGIEMSLPRWQIDEMSELDKSLTQQLTKNPNGLPDISAIASPDEIKLLSEASSAAKISYKNFKQFYSKLAEEDRLFESFKPEGEPKIGHTLGQGKLKLLVDTAQKLGDEHISNLCAHLFIPKDLQKISFIPTLIQKRAIPYLNGKCLEKRKFILNGHTQSVMTVMFTHDTKYTKDTIYEKALISGSLGQNKNTFLWYSDNEKDIKNKWHSTLTHEDGIFCIASSRNGEKYIYGGNHFSPVLIIDINNKTKTMAHGISTHGRTITSAAFNPDGDTIFFGTTQPDNNLCVTNITTPTPLFQPSLLNAEHPGGATSVAWNKNGKYMLSGGHGKQNNLILWEVTTSTRFSLPRFIPNELYDVNAVAFSPNGKMIAFGGKGKPNLFLCDINNLDDLKFYPLVGHSQDVCAIAFSPDGNELFSGSSASNDSLIRWNIKDLNAITPTIAPNFSKSVNSIAINDDGTQMAVGCNGNYENLFLIKFLSKQETKDLKDLGSINQATFVNDLCEKSLVYQSAISLDQSEQGKFSKLSQEVQELLTKLLDIENAPQLQASIKKTATSQENIPAIQNPPRTVFPRKTYSPEEITKIRAGQQAQAEKNEKRLRGRNTPQIAQQNPITAEDQPKPENTIPSLGNKITATLRSIFNWIAAGISSLANWLHDIFTKQ